MKTILTRSAAMAAIGLSLFCTACTKGDSAPVGKRHWVRVYNDVTLGDQENHTAGHFLKTRNGNVVKVENAQDEQAYLSLMYYTQYYANYVVLTFPGNGRAAAAYTDIDVNRLFVRNPGGIDNWLPRNRNTGEIDQAFRSGAYMSSAEFDALASSKSWTDFDAKYNYYNGDSPDLSAGSYVIPGAGNIYLVQLNNTVRALLRVKSVVPESNDGGSIRFDLVIEGGDDYAGNTDAANVQPE